MAVMIGVTVGMCLFSTLVVQPALLRVAAPRVAPNRFRLKKKPAPEAEPAAAPEMPAAPAASEEE